MKVQIFLLRIDPPAEVTVSKAARAPYNIKNSCIDMALLLFCPQYGAQQATIIEITREGRS